MSEDFTIRPGRREDAAEAARLWMQSAEEHTAHDRVYETAPGAEKVMRRFLADVTNSGYSFLFVAAAGEQTVGFISGELRQGSPTFLPKRSEEHTSELQSRQYLVCRLLLEK